MMTDIGLSSCDPFFLVSAVHLGPVQVNERDKEEGQGNSYRRCACY
jgi:hypothetical protein